MNFEFPSREREKTFEFPSGEREEMQDKEKIEKPGKTEYIKEKVENQMQLLGLRFSKISMTLGIKFKQLELAEKERKLSFEEVLKENFEKAVPRHEKIVDYELRNTQKQQFLIPW